MREHRNIRIACLTALVAGVFLAAGCGKPGTGPRDTSSDKVAKVSVVHPSRKSIQRIVEQPGSIQAYEQTQLAARVPGYVRLPYDPQGRLLVDIGRRVHGPKYDSAGKEIAPGEILAELLVPELEQETKQKEALVRQAQADVEQADKALAAADAFVVVRDAGVIEAQALNDRWESESRRMDKLAKGGVVDAQSREEILNQFRAAGGRLASAKAGVLKAKADRDKSEADVKAMKARVDVASAEARRLEAMLGYAKIRAPFDGVITRRKVNTGDFVQPSAGVGKSDWLFTVARLDPVRVVVEVPEADAALVREKAEVKLTVQALEGPVLTGSVARTSWDLEPGARTLRTEIDLPNKTGTLRPGMYVYARITCSLPEAWVVPASAVIKQNDTMVCFLLESGKAVRAAVQLGRGNGEFVEVLAYQKGPTSAAWKTWTGQEEVITRASGLSDGQEVVREGGGK
jgi:HlyD family secretion protein